jgi:hypothetical protein
MKFLIALLTLSLTTVAGAQSRIVSIDAFDLSYTGGLLIKTDNGKGADRDTNAFKINLNYAQNWGDYVGLMWKAKVFINRTEVDFGSNDVVESSWGGAAGFLYNFQSDNIKESFFAGALVGIERAVYEYGSEDDEAGFNFFTDLEVGKRFDLGQYSSANISYAPSFNLNLKRYGGDIRDNYFKSGNEIRINFLKFDVLF